MKTSNKRMVSKAARITLLVTILLATAFTLSCVDVCCKSNVGCVEITKKFSEVIDEKDSIKVINHIIAKTNDSLKQLISDNITVENMTKSNEFYSNAVDRIQNAFLVFLTFIAALTTFSFIYNYKFGKYDKKLSELENKLKNELQQEKNTIFKEIANMYFSSALAYLNQNWLQHFTYLRRYYDLIIDKKLKLTGVDLGYLEQLYSSIIKLYQGTDFIIFASSNYPQLYLGTLKAFVQYCKETDKSQHFAEAAEKLYNKSREIFSPYIQQFSKEVPYDSVQNSPAHGSPSVCRRILSFLFRRRQRPRG